MRRLGWLGVFMSVMALAMYAGTPVSGQQQHAASLWHAPATRHHRVRRKAGDLQGAAHAVGRPRSAGRVVERRRGHVSGRPRRRGGGGRGARGAARRAAQAAPAQAAPAGPPPLYLDDAALKARQDQVAAAAKRSDTQRGGLVPVRLRTARLPADASARRPAGRSHAVRCGPTCESRGMPRGTYGPGPLNSWKDFSLYERCITRGIGGSVLRVIYGNGNRIVQSPGAVAFSYEMLSDTRIFYTDGRPHINQKIAQYLGDSRAHWEGEELVVETTNLTDQTAFGVNGNGTQHSKAMKITERFRRVADDIVQYQATWDDPLTFRRRSRCRSRSRRSMAACCFRTTATPATRRSRCHSAPSVPRTRRSPLTSQRASSVPRRTVQDCGAGVGGAPVAGCTPGAPAAGGGRGGGRGGRGGAAEYRRGHDRKVTKTVSATVIRPSPARYRRLHPRGQLSAEPLLGAAHPAFHKQFRKVRSGVRYRD